MRPPQNAGESFVPRRVDSVAQEASMRPPQNAGESERLLRENDMLQRASMRPPQNAGESEPPAPVLFVTDDPLQ